MTEENPIQTKEPKSKKKKIITIICIVILALILIFASYVVYKRYFAKEKSATIFTILKPVTPVKTTIANNLDGTQVSPDTANRHPLAIMVENHPDARPQSGLDKASIVYEAITEGGITRFMAIYGPNDADKVGPVRSARTYYIDWLSEFNAFYAHVGGNLDALDKIKTDNILNLDEFGLGDSAYWRTPKTGLATEHTMYTSTQKLYKYAFETKKWPTTATYRVLSFINPTEESLRSNGQKIEIDFSSAEYKVDWTYDKINNIYLRRLAGIPHIDAVTGKQLSGTNIIIQEVNRWDAPTTINENGWAMQTIGTGKALIFSQGKKISGTWNKTDQTSRTVFLDETGKEISFTPGQFWIEITPPEVFSKIKITDLSTATN